MTLRELCQRCVAPTAVRSVHGWLSVFWLANVPPFVAAYFLLSYESFVRVSLLYLGVVSIWANVATHFTGWIAGRIEVKQEEESSP